MIMKISYKSYCPVCRTMIQMERTEGEINSEKETGTHQCWTSEQIKEDAILEDICQKVEDGYVYGGLAGDDLYGGYAKDVAKMYYDVKFKYNKEVYKEWVIITILTSVSFFIVGYFLGAG